MSNTWGTHIKLSIFGESHGHGVGITIGGLKPGITLDMDFIRTQMARRAPGKSELSTSRTETDDFEILSGLYENKTTGAPLTIFIRNENVRSSDYDKNIFRPGHADLTAFYKYKGFADIRGGGHFSGRLTAPIVFAGAVAKQILKDKGIDISAKINAIGGIYDKHTDTSEIGEISKKDFPVKDDKIMQAMKNAILDAKNKGDSLGGIIECAITGIPTGLGSPFFDSVESTISSMIFSIPAIKGIEFGDGFGMAEKKGSEANDQMYIENNKIKLKTNHNGGILGGITNGEPIVFRAAVKPTPTIAVEQDTINIEKMENHKLKAAGRHDPCIVLRAVPVIEAAAAICVLELTEEK